MSISAFVGKLPFSKKNDQHGASSENSEKSTCRDEYNENSMKGKGKRWRGKLFFFIFSISLSLALLSTFAYDSVSYKQVDVKKFQSKLHEKEEYADATIKKICTIIERQGVEKVFGEKNLYETSRINQVTFHIYKGENLIFWSSQRLSLQNGISDFPYDKIFLDETDEAIVEVRQSFIREYRVVALVKIKSRLYPQRNDPKNKFAKGFDVPGSVVVSSELKGANFSTVICSKEHKPLFSLQNRIYKTNNIWGMALRCILWTLTFVLLVVFLQYAIKGSRGKSVGLDSGKESKRNAFIDTLRLRSRHRGLNFCTLLILKTLPILWVILSQFFISDLISSTGMNVAVPFVQYISLPTALMLLIFLALTIAFIWLLMKGCKLYARRGNLMMILTAHLLVTGVATLILLGHMSLYEVGVMLVISVVILSIDLLEIYFRLNPFVESVFLIFVFANLVVGVTDHYSAKVNEKKYVEMAKEIASRDCVYKDRNAEEILQERTDQILSDTMIFRQIHSSQYNEEELSKYIWNEYFNVFNDKYDFEIQLCREGDSLEIRKANYAETKFSTFFMAKNRFRKIPLSIFYVNKEEYLGISYLGELKRNDITLYLKFYRNPKYDRLSFLEQSMRETPDQMLSFAKYVEGDRIYTEGEFRYPVSMSWLSVDDHNTDYSFSSNFNNHYIHKFDKGRSLSVASVPERQNFVYAILTTCLFATYLICGLFYFGVRNLIRTITHRRRTFLTRIQLSFIIPTVLSFVVISLVTFPILTDQLRGAQLTEMKEKSLSIQQVLQERIRLSDNLSKLSEGTFSEIKNLSDQFHVELLLFDKDGRLMYSTRPLFVALDRKESNLVNPIVKFVATEESVTTKANVGEMDYFVHCAKAYNLQNVCVGYIQILSNQAYVRAKNDVINMLSLITDVYLFVASLSVLLIWLLNEKMTQPLQMISEHLTKVQLNGSNSLIAYPYDDEIGELVDRYNLMVMQLDESARQLAQSEREYAWREMARRIAHEIKNPLTPMRLRVQQCMRKQQMDPDNFNDYFKETTDILIEQIDNLANIASSFSSFAKAAEARPVKTDIKEKLRMTVSLFVNNTEEVDFSYKQNDESPIYVWIDDKQLLQIFNNLFRNAIQSIPVGRKGYVSVNVDKEGGKVYVSVRDNGCGILQENREKLFEPNFTTKTSGMGLGLAIVKNILIAAGGDIEFETKVGEGTTFYMKLPVIEG